MTSASCPNCGSVVRPDEAFCSTCGAALRRVSQASAAPTARTETNLAELLGQIGRERTGLMAALTVAVVCIIVAYVAWTPLSWPSRLIRDILPEANCTGKVPGTSAMYVCSAKVGALQVVGPLGLSVLVVLLRRQIKTWLDANTRQLPPESGFLLTPVIATLAFTLAWSGFHYNTADLSGFLPQRMFPAVIGLFTFAVSRWGPDLQRSLAGFFDFREKIPVPLRFLILIAIPVLISYLTTNQDRVSDTAMKEQLVVLVALALGFLMLAPRSGGVLAGISQAIGVRRRA